MSEHEDLIPASRKESVQWLKMAEDAMQTHDFGSQMHQVNARVAMLCLRLAEFEEAAKAVLPCLWSYPNNASALGFTELERLLK